MDDRQLAQLINGTTDAIKGLRADFNKSSVASTQYDSPYSMLAIDLTHAHTFERITVQNPVSFIQFWCDGGLEGIKINMGQQSAQTLDLSQMRVIPITTTYKDLYLTNDVRQGRSTLVIYFVRQYSPLELNYGGQDVALAELAVRLGAISRFDRRGQVSWQSSFEDNLNCVQIYTVAGFSTVALSTAYARSGGVSVKMYSPDNANHDAQVIKSIPFANQSPFGLEVSFTRDNSSNSMVKVELNCFDGVNLQTGQLIYYEATGTLKYMDSTGAEVTLSAAIPIDSDMDFNTVKLVIDPINRMYVRAIFNAFTFDMRNIFMTISASAQSAHLQAIVTENVCVNAPASIYIDDMIITRDEQ
jgi:hypothetical protein